MQDKFRAAPAAQLKEAKEKYENKWSSVEADRFLNNLKIKGIEFWTPLEGTADWAECDWNLKKCPYAGLYALKSQVLERREEIEQMMSHALEWSGPAKMEMKMHLLEDMPDLVEEFLRRWRALVEAQLVKQCRQQCRGSHQQQAEAAVKGSVAPKR